MSINGSKKHDAGLIFTTFSRQLKLKLKDTFFSAKRNRKAA